MLTTFRNTILSKRKYVPTYKLELSPVEKDKAFRIRVIRNVSLFFIVMDPIAFVANNVVYNDSDTSFFSFNTVYIVMFMLVVSAFIIVRRNITFAGILLISMMQFAVTMVTIMERMRDDRNYFELAAAEFVIIFAVLVFKKKGVILTGLISILLNSIVYWTQHQFGFNGHFINQNDLSNDLNSMILMLTGITGLLVFFRNEYDKRIQDEAKNLSIVKKELSESEQEFKAIVEDQTELICKIKPNSEISFVNNAFCTYFNKSAEELIGSRFSPVLPNEDLKQVKLVMRNISYDLPVKSMDVRILIDEKRIRWHHWTIRGIYNPSNQLKAYQIVGTDITDRKESEKKLILAKDLAEKSIKAKEEFVANISHELRTPLNTVIGLTYLISETKLTQQQHEYVNTIKLSSDNLLHIINDILDFSKIQSGKIELEENSFNIRDFLNNTLNTVNYKVEEKNLKIKLSIANNVPLIIRTDNMRLSQILLNIVSNAIKFTNNGEILINVKNVKEQKDNVTLEFSVEDTGIGIPKNKLPMIFESFTQADTNTSKKFGGTGLGLTITKSLVKMLGGSIKVKSVLGKGSVFTFTIECEKSKAKTIDVINAIPFYTSMNLQGYRILVVEDNKLNQFLVKQFLENWEVEVTLADNGKQAIALLKKEVYDLVLMDLRMPEMDGYSATKYIKSKKMRSAVREIPIIALTASPVKEEINKALAAGMIGYITKPFKPEKLYESIKSTLSSTKPSISGILSKPKSHYTDIFLNSKYFNLGILKKTDKEKLEFIRKIVADIINQTEKGIVLMKAYFKDNDFENLAKEAHHIKPSLLYFEDKELGNTIIKIEEFAKLETDEGKKDVISLIENLEKIFKQILLNLKSENLI